MLYAFDLDGTLIRSFLRDGGAAEEFDLVEVLPGRCEQLEALARNGARFALVSNQGGVAFGYQTVEQVHAKLGRILAAFEFFWGAAVSVHVAFGHERASVDPWARPEHVRRRKPAPVMLQEAMRAHGVRESHMVYVGDMDSDREAAWEAGVEYADAGAFFGG